MTRPYGTWPSPITAVRVAAQGLRLSGVVADGADVYWVEGRPDERGRQVLMRRDGTGRVRELTPSGFNVRTRVHEYGGLAYAVNDRTICFSNFADQRLYRMGAGDDAAPVPLTPPGAWRYADVVIDAARRRLVCVREDHSTAGIEPTTTIVAVPLDGRPHAGEVLVSGADFYAYPRLSPDGSRLAWISWRHPQMPWDGTDLWVSEIATDGSPGSSVRVAGGFSESVYQPGWGPDGALYFASDLDGWWRLYRADPDGGRVRAVLREPPAHAEFGRPFWVFGTGVWAPAGEGRLAVSYAAGGRWRLAVIDLATGALSDVPTELEPGDWLAATATHAVLVAGSPVNTPAVVRVHLETGAVETLRSSSADRPDPVYISMPETIEFPGTDDLPTHALYYPPRNAACTAPACERPPLIVVSHGGPTAAADPTLDLKVQFWTSRGFAVVDVNYGGSSGFGRAYRDRLRGRWGEVDVIDVVRAAQHLVREGKADPDRLIVRGGSAGGYTALAALTFHPGVFRAGASYYGVSDLEALVRDTHKFESRYLDGLVGPYPEARAEYRARSPVHVIDRLSCALILFQGLEDAVVPPNQSAMMADAARRKGLPVAYLAFEGEQHGFRKADTIARCLEAELYFYGKVFGFEPADRIEPVPIANL